MAHWLDGTLVEIKLESLSVMHPLLACYMYIAYMHIIACMLYLYLLYIYIILYMYMYEYMNHGSLA